MLAGDEDVSYRPKDSIWGMGGIGIKEFSSARFHATSQTPYVAIVVPGTNSRVGQFQLLRLEMLCRDAVETQYA